MPVLRARSDTALTPFCNPVVHPASPILRKVGECESLSVIAAGRGRNRAIVNPVVVARVCEQKNRGLIPVVRPVAHKDAMAPSNRQDFWWWPSFSSAKRLRPDYPPTLANLASILIRDPFSAVFDSARALQYARRASTLTGDENAAILQILARAYAADGQYDAAVLVAERARQRAETTGQDELAAELALLVEQYRARAGDG